MASTNARPRNCSVSPLELLRQTVATNPYEVNRECTEFKAFNQHHWAHLSQQGHEDWKETEKSSLRATGIDEKYHEPQQLLTEIDELIDGVKKKKELKAKKDKDKRE
jgi:hypothetical protein